MPLATSLEIPNGEPGWSWRYEIGRPISGGSRLTFSFEKIHARDGATYFLATFSDHDGDLAAKILHGTDREPLALAGEIVQRWLTMSSEQPPAHVADTMRGQLTAWIGEQRARISKVN